MESTDLIGASTMLVSAPDFKVDSLGASFNGVLGAAVATPLPMHRYGIPRRFADETTGVREVVTA
jgi:hypothetical protein